MVPVKNSPVPVYELHQVSKTFGSFNVLDGISLQINAGERVALVGSSGAGKSTLISLLNGTQIPDAGEIRVLGQDLRHVTPKALRETQRQVGTIYQQFHLVNSLRVIHNVNAGHLGRWSFMKSLISLIRPLEVQMALAALTQVGIPEKLYARTGQLSGGQQQRVAIARVLVQRPQIILADEPIASLDPERSREILDLLHNLSLKQATTLITSLHEIDFARGHYDRIIGLRQGRILFDQPAADVTPKMLSDLYQLAP